jgi:hypothetical protein
VPIINPTQRHKYNSKQYKYTKTKHQTEKTNTIWQEKRNSMAGNNNNNNNNC